MASLLEQLQAKRAEILAEQENTISVPGWDGVLKLRIHALDSAFIASAGAKAQKAKTPEAQAHAALVAAAKVIVEATDAVVLTDDSGEAELDLLSADVYTLLEITDEKTPVKDVLTKLCFDKQGDVVRLSNAIIAFSGFKGSNEDITGE